MKKRYALSAFLVLLTSILLVSSSYTKWEREVIYKGMEFNKLRFIIQESDTLNIEGYLRNPSVVEGIPCCDYILLKKGCRVQDVTLSEKFYMFDILFPKGSLLRFNNEGLSCKLASNTMVQGYLCYGNYANKPSKGITTSFYENGELKSFFPPEDVLIYNILCKSGGSSLVGLHMNGKLKQCTLASDQDINGNSYKKNTELFFDEKGQVISNK